jgi:hypothetical protein
MARWFAFGSLALLAAVLGLTLGVFFPLRSDGQGGAPTPVRVNKVITLEPPEQSTGP